MPLEHKTDEDHFGMAGLSTGGRPATVMLPMDEKQPCHSVNSAPVSLACGPASGHFCQGTLEELCASLPKVKGPPISDPIVGPEAVP